LTSDSPSELIVLAIKVDDPTLADRLTALLSDVPGLRLARLDEQGDVNVVSSHTAEKAAQQDTAALTPREIEVLTLLAEGATNKSIARRLGISVHTVKFHVASLLDKFEAIGRTDAVTQAVRLGVIQL
jgi:DNA-binding CsgD family transcriptional regulator